MDGDQQSIYEVATFGIGDADLEVLRRIFVVSAERPNIYRLLPAESDSRKSRIMMLDRSDPGGVSAWAKAQKSAPKPVRTVILTQDEPGVEALFLRRPLIATRVLGVLDRAVQALESQPATAGPVESAFVATSSKITHHRKYRALVVDDSLMVRKQIAMALEKVRIDANFAESGEQALAALEKSEYDIVFMDVMMPGIDGFDACKQIKRDPDTQHIPVVLLTGKTSALDRVKGKMSGCDTYLAKPVDKDTFYQTLRKYLRQRTAVS